MTPEERAAALASRRACQHPYHSPPHPRRSSSHHTFHLTAACYEHRPHIGAFAARLDDFSARLRAEIAHCGDTLHAWCVLPDHYHLLVTVQALEATTRTLGRLHGATSFQWNGEEGRRGRKVWHACADRAIRSDAHFLAAMNYIHHNPVRHGYAEKWGDWPWSSAPDWLEEVGEAEAARIWREFPVLDFGRGWDEGVGR